MQNDVTLVLYLCIWYNQLEVQRRSELNIGLTFLCYCITIYLLGLHLRLFITKNKKYFINGLVWFESELCQYVCLLDFHLVTGCVSIGKDFAGENLLMVIIVYMVGTHYPM